MKNIIIKIMVKIGLIRKSKSKKDFSDFYKSYINVFKKMEDDLSTLEKTEFFQEEVIDPINLRILDLLESTKAYAEMTRNIRKNSGNIYN